MEGLLQGFEIGNVRIYLRINRYFGIVYSMAILKKEDKNQKEK